MHGMSSLRVVFDSFNANAVREAQRAQEAQVVDAETRRRHEILEHEAKKQEEEVVAARATNDAKRCALYTSIGCNRLRNMSTGVRCCCPYLRGR